MIKFRCPNCNQKIGVPERCAGKRAKCAKCHQALQVPEPPKASIQEDSTSIKFHCSSCNQKLNAPSDLTGKAVSCPRCKERIRVPETVEDILRVVPPQEQASRDAPGKRELMFETAKPAETSTESSMVDKEVVAKASQEREKSFDEEVSQIRPWVRYWARYCDLSLFTLFCVLIKTPSFLFRMLTLFIWIFIEGCLLSTWGTTPGKWLLKIRLTDSEMNKLTFSEALGRSFSVWFKGLGMGFPIISLITRIIAYIKLKRNGITTWDWKGDYVVTHKRIGALRVVVTIFFVGLPVIYTGIGYRSMLVSQTYTEWIGTEAPDFTLEDIDGHLINLSSFRGKRVILDFWATWCPPCKREIPHFVKLYETTDTEELIIIGISNESSEVVRDFAKKHNINYVLITIIDEELPKPYSSVRSIPTTFFIDRDGVIESVLVGYHSFKELKNHGLGDYEKVEDRLSDITTSE